jgi:hypothetical protein
MILQNLKWGLLKSQCLLFLILYQILKILVCLFSICDSRLRFLCFLCIFSFHLVLEHSGLAMITAAAEIINSPQRQSSEPTTPQKMQIQHPKKLKLKTKDDPDSMPSSPMRPILSSSSSNYNNNSSSNLLNDDHHTNRPYFMTTPFNSTSRSVSVNSNNMNNGNNQHSEENKAKIHEILQMGIARAQQQRADEIKIVTCNCKKSKCLKMLDFCHFFLLVFLTFPDDLHASCLLLFLFLLSLTSRFSFVFFILY